MLCYRIFPASLIFLFIAFTSIAQPGTSLPKSIPEEQGVSSRDISRFLEATAKSKTEFHSFMLLRHGKVIAEGWWNPYRADLKHTLYSCSKSFTATAIGFAIYEKKLSLTDKVISFFPGELPETVSPYLAELTVKDVLIMSDGMEPDPTGSVTSKDSNWVRGFFATPIKNKPGTKFLYNSLGTYLLSAIIQKATGQQTIAYLRPRLFDPLGTRGMDWETDTRGVNTGGWGLRVRTEDMAKFAQLFLQKGKWNGKQVLPPGWTEEAGTMKIMQDPDAPKWKKDSSDWLQGYCYQMWRCRHNAYRGDGAFGQFMIVMPDQDAALAITAETPDMQEEINLVWRYLLPAFKKGKLPADKAGNLQLQQKLKSLTLPVAVKRKENTEMAISGKTFDIASNALRVKKIGFDFTPDQCRVQLHVNTGVYELNFGAGNWQYGQTNLPGPSLVAASIENNSMIYPAKIAGSYTWKDPNTLQLVLRYIESPHTETLTCHFDGNKMSISLAKSFEYGKNNIELHGEVK